MPTISTKPIYSGKAKDIFETEDPEVLRAYFRDSATAFNAQKKGEIHDKGKVNASISKILFQLCEQNGIKTHFVRQISKNELLIKRVKIIPLEVIVRNIAAGSLCKRLGIKEGKILKEPIVEFSYKNDELGDPLLTRAYIKSALEVADDKLLDSICELALKTNKIFVEFFKKIGIKVVDFKLEFGTDKDGKLLLADELSPDNFRFWDDKTNEKLDKDRFRQDLGNVEGAYQEMLKRVELGAQSLEKSPQLQASSLKPQASSFKSQALSSKVFSVRVQVLPKPDILDPQGQAVESSLNSLGYKGIQDLKIGKEIVFKVESGSKESVELQVNEMCDKLLANPVIEDYKIEID